jgi:choline dehydrogenase
MEARYDYVIIGAGSAGCVLAHRLSADPRLKVLLIESGGPDRHPFISMPRALAKIMGNPKYIWPFQTNPEQQSNGMSEFWARGRTLGGSSAINGMMYVRGHGFDFDDLAAQADEQWNWDHMGAAYKDLENHQLGASATRGNQGPLRITLPAVHSRLGDDLIQACTQMGMALTEDVNDPRGHERVGYAPCTIYKGLATPAILQRSGIGPAKHLQDLGIPVVAENAAVGENLGEHRGIVMQWRAPDVESDNRGYRGGGLFWIGGKVTCCLSDH